MTQERAIALCASCGIPGAVVFEDGKIVGAFFVCKCPRPTVEEVNESIKLEGDYTIEDGRIMHDR